MLSDEEIHALHGLPMWILSELEDLETPSLILNLLNNEELGFKKEHAAPFSNEEVVTTLMRLIDCGLVVAYREDDSSDRLVPVTGRLDDVTDKTWFGRTELGRSAMLRWEALYPE